MPVSKESTKFLLVQPDNHSNRQEDKMKGESMKRLSKDPYFPLKSLYISNSP